MRIPWTLVIPLTLCFAQERAILPRTAPSVKALVIGINHYPKLGAGGNLHNSVNDATDFADMLEKQVGVARADIQLLTADEGRRVLTLDDLKNAAEDFYRRLREGDTAIFFYSGHGVQVENDPSPNFLVPSDLEAGTLEVDLKQKAYPLSRVIQLMESKRTGLRLLFVDACRNNPWIEEQRRGRGLGDQTVDPFRPPQNVANGTVIGYAVSPGEKALDRSPNGRNGMYTYYLLRNLPRPGVDVIDALRDLAGDVYRNSGEKMTPSYYGNILTRVSLVGGGKVTPPLPAPAPVMAELTPGMVRANGKDGLPYAWIPPGRFMMGCSPSDNQCENDEKPAREETIAKGFWIGRTEVTQEAYQRVMGTNPSKFREGRRPVESVPWDKAASYCSQVGMRLPTEVEWEYAARAGDPGSQLSILDRVAWYKQNAGAGTHEVGTQQANNWGLFDMLGNVWEWTTTVDPVRRAYIFRGGSWNNAAKFARVSERVRLLPGYNGADGIGFRCVGDLR
jgi:hypothetical protein